MVESRFYANCGNDKQLSIIAGPCVFEGQQHMNDMVDGICEVLNKVASNAGLKQPINFVYKTSFDKANRTSASSYRGKGFDEAFYAMRDLQIQGIEVLTDVHENWHCEAVPCNIIQIPAFLCRQTDLLKAAAESGKIVNVKKGQFLSPHETGPIVNKLRTFNAKGVMLTERGTTFGYNNLVVDMRSLEIMKGYTNHVIMDCTHAVQQPGGLGDKSGGDRTMANVIARAAAGVGVAGLFLEVHQDPDNAPSDGPNMIKLSNLYDCLMRVFMIDSVSKANF